MITTSRHRYDPTTGYTTSFSVTGRQDRSLYGLASGGARSAGAGAGRGDRARSATPTTRRRQGRVKVTLPVAVRRPTSATGPARSSRAPARTAARWCCPRSATRCWWPSSRATSAARTCSAASTTASTRRRPAASTLIDGGSGAVNRRSFVSRRGHRIDLIDEDGRTEGITLSTTRTTSCSSIMDSRRHHDHRAQRRQGPDRGARAASSSTRRSAEHGAQGQRDLADGDQRGQDRRRRRCGSMSTSGQLSLRGTAKLEGRAPTEVKAAA